MKLYVVNENNERIYLNKVASNRRELQQVLGKNSFEVRGKKYYVRDVKAVTDSNDTITGVVLALAIASLAGPVAAILGGLGGLVLGKASDRRKIENVRKFNKSVKNVK